MSEISPLKNLSMHIALNPPAEAAMIVFMTTTPIAAIPEPSGEDIDPTLPTSKGKFYYHPVLSRTESKETDD